MASSLNHTELGSAPAEEAGAGAVSVAERLERLEAEVVAGKRDARSLLLIQPEQAVRAKVTFPKDPYGPVLDW